MSFTRRQVTTGLISLALLMATGVAHAGPNFVYANTQKPDHPIVQTMEFMAKALRDAASPMDLQIKHSGELGSEIATVDKVKKGELDLVGVNLALFANSSHTANILTLPFLFRSKEHVWKVLNGDIGKKLEAELAANNLVLVGFFDSGFRSFYSVKKPIRTLQDFEGMRVRVLGTKIYADFLQQLGATAVNMPFAETAAGLRDGKLDAADNNIVTYVTSEHYKYAKYLSLDEHSMVPDVLLMSKKAWSSLSPAQQAQLKQAVVSANVHLAQLWTAKEQELLALAKKNGVTVYTKQQMALSGIEGLAYRVYNKQLSDPKDLDMVLKISGFVQ